RQRFEFSGGRIVLGQVAIDEEVVSQVSGIDATDDRLDATLNVVLRPGRKPVEDQCSHAKQHGWSKLFQESHRRRLDEAHGAVGVQFARTADKLNLAARVVDAKSKTGLPAAATPFARVV